MNRKIDAYFMSAFIIITNKRSNIDFFVAHRTTQLGNVLTVVHLIFPRFVFQLNGVILFDAKRSEKAHQFNNRIIIFCSNNSLVAFTVSIFKKR